ncbi:superoxide dismutase [Brevundimonas sp. SORGH_AS_0993]|uniref:superoxide dismutase n=1 Tax=Brevundimonas sp. SORGH_AS_0993 TaxID=3041794 RepID=UPI00277F38B0|nr:superoxide dismutase [Brevundimonas sp. SORGH_AS_0993]MDQ1153244.1 Fe-Mn family superoxide dismutase [Brevundimonas sp. SORGH_AS_0993]
MIRPLALQTALALSVFIAAPALAQNAPAASAQAVASAPAAFTLPALPYAPEALEPAIDAETMRIHHDRHHKAYVDNLNAAVAADPALAGVSIEDLMARASTLPAAVRNNGGGHWNHSLFWTLMAPAGQGGAPSPELAAAITRDFGSMDAFKTAFNRATTSRFGSGWAWLIVKDGKLVVTSTPNQDNPLMDVAETRGAPILGVDVWEHAYYLKYQNKRADYLAAWWTVVNWNTVNQLYAAAK